MQTLLVAVMLLGLLAIPVSVWRARREHRPVKVFDDIVTHLVWPLILLPLAVPMPPTAMKIVFAVAGGILIAGIGPLIRRSRALLRGRAHDAPDER